jgi:U3 small nucleolar RNA-associated protein 13
MEELSKLEDIGGIMQACRAYTERHRSRLERLYRGTFMVDILLSRTGAIVDDEETEEELRKSRETIDDFGFMRADGAAPPPRLLAPAAPQLAAVSEEEEEDDGEEPADDVSDEAMDEEDEEEEEEDEDEDEDEDESEEEPLAKEDVKEEDVAMGPPKKLKRLSILKRVASDVEKQQKLLRDPSPRHTRSGKKLGFK